MHILTMRVDITPPFIGATFGVPQLPPNDGQHVCAVLCLAAFLALILCAAR